MAGQMPWHAWQGTCQDIERACHEMKPQDGQHQTCAMTTSEVAVATAAVGRLRLTEEELEAMIE